MAKIKARESQNVEYKSSWHDEYLKWICGFANAQGAVMYFGVNNDHEVIGLEDVDLINDEGKLKNAALLLFAKRPQRYFTSVRFHIGRFSGSEANLITQDVIEGNIIQMADRVVEILKSKYLTMPSLRLVSSMPGGEDTRRYAKVSRVRDCLCPRLRKPMAA